MNDLIEAIVDRFDNAATLAPLHVLEQGSVVIRGGCWFDEVAVGVGFPYCRFHDVSPEKLQHTFGSCYIDPTSIQFSIFAVPTSTMDAKQYANHLMSLLCAVYDRSKFALDDGRMMSFVRTMHPTTVKEEKKDGANRPVYHCFVRYDVRTQRSF